MRTKPIGLYVHVPFCVKKCNYCDFCSFSNLEKEERSAYINALICEIGEYWRKEKIPVDTLFFGGGTPSLLTPDEFFLIFETIEKSFDISALSEFTVEVNPKTLTPELLGAFVSKGVNRVSIGLQSIHENEMKSLGRIHNLEDFYKTYELVRSAGIANVSVDLMFGIVHQTEESFTKTLDEVIRLNPDHVSVYGLILEEGTPFYEMGEKLVLPSEDEETEMYSLAHHRLTEAGYSHYEISNFSKKDFSARHNLKYWHAEEYVGVGISAYSYFEGKRYGNSRIMSEYLSLNRRSYIQSETVTEKDKAYEYAILGLRLSEGISLLRYKSLGGADIDSGLLMRYVDGGYATIEGDRLSLTYNGFYISNKILSDLF